MGYQCASNHAQTHAGPAFAAHQPLNITGRLRKPHTMLHKEPATTTCRWTAPHTHTLVTACPEQRPEAWRLSWTGVTIPGMLHMPPQASRSQSAPLACVSPCKDQPPGVPLQMVSPVHEAPAPSHVRPLTRNLLTRNLLTPAAPRGARAWRPPGGRWRQLPGARRRPGRRGGCRTAGGSRAGGGRGRSTWGRGQGREGGRVCQSQKTMDWAGVRRQGPGRGGLG